MQIPKNVIQTGKTDPCHKIYMEDYVHTLLTQYRENEADFCLYGKREQEGEVSYYFIYGAAKEEPGWELMESRYFALQPRIGEVTFDEKEAWAFFEDGFSTPLDGYFIFYEQNEDMQSYLIAMHQNQPGEKTVEVRHRTARRAQEPQSSPRELQSGQEEPRRIRRSPMVYDLKGDQQRPEKGEKEEREKTPASQEEKVIHAAQTGREAARRLMGQERSRRTGRFPDSPEGSGKRTAFRIKAAALAVLLGLCAAAVTSVNGYQDAEEVGNFFTQALDELKGGNPDGGNPGGGSGGGNTANIPENGVLIVEETQLTPSEGIVQEAAAEAAEETFPEIQESLVQEPSAVSPVQEDGSSAARPESESGADPVSESSPESEIEQKEDAEAAAQAASAETVTYVVKRGDSLAAICRRQYGNTDRVGEIAALNRLENPNHLIPGQKILLPQE